MFGFLSCVHGISIRLWRRDCWKQAAKQLLTVWVQLCMKLAFKNVLCPSDAQWVYNIIHSVYISSTFADQPPPLNLYKTVHESIAEELLKQHRL